MLSQSHLHRHKHNHASKLCLLHQPCRPPRRLLLVRARSDVDPSVKALEAAIGAINKMLSAHQQLTGNRQGRRSPGGDGQPPAGTAGAKQRRRGKGKVITFKAQASSSRPVEELFPALHASLEAGSSNTAPTITSTSSSSSAPAADAQLQPDTSRSLQRYLSLPLDQYSVLDPRYISVLPEDWDPATHQRTSRTSSTSSNGGSQNTSASSSTDETSNSSGSVDAGAAPAAAASSSSGESQGTSDSGSTSSSFLPATAATTSSSSGDASGATSSSSSSSAAEASTDALAAGAHQLNSSGRDGSAAAAVTTTSSSSSGDTSTSSSSSEDTSISSSGSEAGSAVETPSVAMRALSLDARSAGGSTADGSTDADDSCSSSSSPLPAVLLPIGCTAANFLLRVPLADVVGVDLTPELVFRVTADTDVGRVTFTTLYLSTGEPAVDSDLLLDIHAQLDRKLLAPLTQRQQQQQQPAEPQSTTGSSSNSSGSSDIAEPASSSSSGVEAPPSTGAEEPPQQQQQQQQEPEPSAAMDVAAPLPAAAGWQQKSQLQCAVSLKMKMQVGHPLSIVPGPLLSATASLVAQLTMKALLPSFLELLATDYSRWAGGSSTSSRQVVPAGDLLAAAAAAAAAGN